MFKLSKRLQNLPAYLFLELDKAKRKAREGGRDIIDFGIGDPDRPTPSHIIKGLSQAVKDPATHRYALDQGLAALRKAIAKWYRDRFKVGLDAQREILPLIGSKEGIAHFPLAFLNPGDYTLVPEPCYPPYKGGTILAGAKPYSLPLLERNNFLPDFERVPLGVLKKAKIVYINYPNNPTAAVADLDFYRRVVAFAKKYKLIVISDLAYSEIVYDGYKSPSFLQVRGAKEVGIEFHSLSKTYNMTGWRLGWACGNKRLIDGLGKVKSNIDSGIFTAIQIAGITALKSPPKHIEQIRRLYQRRRDTLVEGLQGLGWSVTKPKATFYIWLKIPYKKYDSFEFSRYLLQKAAIVVTPGAGFGRCAEGYVRFALTVPQKRIIEAIGRIRRII
jgi:LL-diaminopimelate aminotransferase